MDQNDQFPALASGSRGRTLGCLESETLDRYISKLENDSKKTPEGLAQQFNPWGAGRVRGRGELLDMVRKSCPPDVNDLAIQKELSNAGLAAFQSDENWSKSPAEIEDAKTRWKQPEPERPLPTSAAPTTSADEYRGLDAWKMKQQPAPGFAMKDEDFPPL